MFNHSSKYSTEAVILCFIKNYAVHANNWQLQQKGTLLTFPTVGRSEHAPAIRVVPQFRL
jgi:hypothetical protein